MKLDKDILNAQIMKLKSTKEQFSYGDLMLVETFNKYARSGYLIPYDGVGCYVDFNGNELGDINWFNIEDYPKEAVFVAWYNK